MADFVRLTQEATNCPSPITTAIEVELVESRAPPVVNVNVLIDL